MESSSYPTLDRLDVYGLRAAYALLLFGAGSWSNVESLHRWDVPETCRLPRQMLLALKSEYRRMVGNAIRSPLADQACLMDEFNRARNGRTLEPIHVAALNERLEGNRALPANGTTAVDDENALGLMNDEWIDGIHYDCKSFWATWQGYPVKVALARRHDGILHVSIRLDVPVTEAVSVDFARRGGTRLINARKDSAHLWLTFKLMADAGLRTTYYRGSGFGMVSEETFALIAARLAQPDIGITGLRHD